MIKGINHLTLSASNLACSLEFYSKLGFTPRVKWYSGAYLSAQDVWLWLNAELSAPAQDYSHVAFTVTLIDLNKYRSLCNKYGWEQWQANASEGDSLYILDPAGHKLELHCGDIETRLTHLKESPYEGLEWL